MITQQLLHLKIVVVVKRRFSHFRKIRFQKKKVEEENGTHTPKFRSKNIKFESTRIGDSKCVQWKCWTVGCGVSGSQLRRRDASRRTYFSHSHLFNKIDIHTTYMHKYSSPLYLAIRILLHTLIPKLLCTLM